MGEYVKDRIVRRRIGCSSKDCTYAVYTDGDSVDPVIPDASDSGDDVDNLMCDGEFDTVSDGYSGLERFMRAGIMKYRKVGDSKPELVGIYSHDGMYRMESTRGVSAYLGRDGRAQCIAIPQCKMMNSTVLDGEWVRHPVYVGENVFEQKERDVASSGICKDRGRSEEWIYYSLGCYAKGTHVPFDLWCVLGAVYGKALRVWRGVAKLDWRRMPCWMYVELKEVFEALNPGSHWRDLSSQSRLQWRHWLVDSFRRMRSTWLAWDMPSDNGRVAHLGRMLESTMVSQRVQDSRASECEAEWGDVYEPCGFKVRLRGTRIFDFCWRNMTNSPSVVQIRRYEHDSQRVLGVRGWTRCFHLIYASWLVQYRNYWKRRGGGYDSCVLEWSQREMLHAFEGSVFPIAHLSTSEMVSVLDYHTVGHVAKSGERRPAHCGSVSVVRRCVVSWELPKSLSGEDVILKDSRGVNMSLSDSGIAGLPQEVVLARSRMNEVNEENARHLVTFHGRRVDTHESVIYRCERDANGALQGVWDRNGRCYSMRNGIQSLGKSERAEVLIDGRRTTEVDYSSLHPRMLYAQNGIEYRGDVYNVGRWFLRHGLAEDVARQACKKMMLIGINARNKVAAMRAFKKDWNLDHGLARDAFIPWLYDLYDAIRRRHWRIAHEFCTGKGVYLMNLDGRLLREVCHRLAREGICALGVHDSVIVESRYASRAAGIMKEEFARMFNGIATTVKY